MRSLVGLEAADEQNSAWGMIGSRDQYLSDFKMLQPYQEETVALEPDVVSES